MRFPHWLVDFGEVISTPQPDHHVDGLVELSGLHAPVFVERYWQHRPAYDGGMSTRDYWSAVLGRLPDDVLIDDLHALDVESWTRIDPDMLALLDEARAAGVQLTLLSNAAVDFGEAFRRLPALTERFDRLVISGDLGVIKPDPEIYHAALGISGFGAAETLFIDDRPENVAAAEALGITGLVFRGVDDLRERLVELGMGSASAQ